MANSLVYIHILYTSHALFNTGALGLDNISHMPHVGYNYCNTEVCGKCIILTSGMTLNQLDSVLLKLLCGDARFFRFQDNKNYLLENKQVINHIVSRELTAQHNRVLGL